MKKTALQKEYDKLRKQLMQKQRRAERLGVVFAEKVAPVETALQLKYKNKRVTTKLIERVRKQAQQKYKSAIIEYNIKKYGDKYGYDSIVDFKEKGSFRQELSPLEKEYAKQRSRLLKLQKNIEKRGYLFTENLAPDKSASTLRDLGIEITKEMVEKLKKIKGYEAYKNTVYYDQKLGKWISGIERRKQEYQEAAKKRKEKDGPGPGPEPPSFDSIRAVREILSYLPMERYFNGSGWVYYAPERSFIISTFENRVNEAINNGDTRELAKNFERYAERIKEAVNICINASKQGEVDSAFDELAEIIKGAELTREEKKQIGEELDTDFFYGDWDDIVERNPER